MKKKFLNKKLQLNKESVSNLSIDEMKKFVGGVVNCPVTENPKVCQDGDDPDWPFTKGPTCY